MPWPSISSARAQGFNTFSGRNHPELDWQVAETRHFKIMYPSRLAGIETEAASIAEASYAALSKNLNVQFDEKIRVYLSDEDEILNGFASRLGYTNIWVHVNDVARQWTGNTKWLRTVLSHELAHIFHGEAVRGNRGLLADFLTGDPMPGFWTEGLAQYQTELWHATRGERWLRTAVLDDRLSYNDGLSVWNGRLQYAVGNAQVRYIASQYGDSTLAHILQHRTSSLLGLLKTHDFYTAFEEVTDLSYRSFYDEWRRHINVYYNTIAGQMENADSLGADPLPVPGQYLYDVQFSPDTTRLAVLSLTSLARPVVRLFALDPSDGSSQILADGAIQSPVAWSPDGTSIAFARRTRGQFGSIVNDLFRVDVQGGTIHRLTHSRRAVAPSFSPDGSRLAFIGSNGGTADVFVLDLKTGRETALTSFEGDVQLSSLKWHAETDRIAFSVFDPQGLRTIYVLDPSSGKTRKLLDETSDNQYPVWSPDGSQVAFTSLRDQIPNVFIHDLATDSTHRVTRLATGASVYDWVKPDSIYPQGSLIIAASVSKQKDEAYRISAARRTVQPPVEVPQAYSYWTRHRPPSDIPQNIEPAGDAILSRYPYRALKNITHAFSLGVPYYNHENDWGVFGFTSWTEPLAKHNIAVSAGLSIPRPLDHSFGLLAYINNQLKPSLAFNVYRLFPTATAYGSTYAVTELDGGDGSVHWPLDLMVRPYTATRLSVRLRHAAFSLLNPGDFEAEADAAQAPQEGEQTDLRISFTRKTQRPYRYNVIHPLDGAGLQLRLTGASRWFGGDTRYVRGDLTAFSILPMPGLHRLYLMGKAQALTGRSFNQNRPGFARFDDIQLSAPQLGTLSLSNSERVRGFRRFAYGDRLLFGSAEYRMPFIPSLETTLLGLVSLGATTAAAFVDAGVVWEGGDIVTRRTGLGVELKNALTIGGVLQVMHAFGIAQPASDVLTSERYDLYYRVRTSLPF